MTSQKRRRSVLLPLACAGAVLLAGCHSTPPPPTVPQAVPAAPVATPSTAKGQVQESASTADGWKTFVGEDGSFSVLMLGAPKKETANATSPFGPITITLYAFHVGSTAYNVDTTEYPVDKITPEKAQALIAQTLAAIHKKPGATILSEKAVTLDGSPGQDMVINNQDVSQLHMKFFLVKNRMYILGSEYPQKQEVPAEAGRYLDSLKLLSPPKK